MKYVSNSEQVDKYFDLLNEIYELRKRKDYQSMLDKCRLSLPLIEAVIEWDENFSGEKWDGTIGLKIPAIEIASPFLAAYGDLDSLKILVSFVYENPKLKYYRETVDRGVKMYELRQKILAKCKTHKEILQKDLKKLLNYNDGRLINLTLQYLEKIGKIKREKVGSTYRIFLK